LLLKERAQSASSRSQGSNSTAASPSPSAHSSHSPARTAATATVDEPSDFEINLEAFSHAISPPTPATHSTLMQRAANSASEEKEYAPHPDPPATAPAKY